MENTFIVAEISNSWVKGESTDNSIISEQFAEIINTNFEKGYELVNWKFNSLIVNERAINETIIAVFKKTKSLN